jgi:beta-galactosidase
LNIDYKHQFEFAEFEIPEFKHTEMQNFDIEESQNVVKISNQNQSVELNKTTGKLHHFLLKNDTIFIDGPTANFWRAPTDNDFGNKMNTKQVYWKTAAENSTLKSLEYIALETYVEINAFYQFPEKHGNYTMNYKIYADGFIDVSIEFDLKKGNDIPRIGSYIKVPQSKSLAQYAGKGPYENYSDRNASAKYETMTGVHNLNIEKQEMPYIRPQEYGNRTDVFFVEMINKDTNNKNTTRIIGNKFNFSAWNHSLWDLDEEIEKSKLLDIGNFKKGGKTPLDIPKRDYIWVNIDYGQRGLGGDNSWGRKPYDKYLLKKGKYSLNYTIYGK